MRPRDFVLSRVADSLYWLGRNVERAETVARVLDVNYTRAMDLYSQRDGRADKLWRSVMRCAGFTSEPEIASGSAAASETFAFCAFDAQNPTSIVSSVRIARANALGIRAELTTEVWEVINVLYLYVEDRDLRSVLREGPSTFLRRIRDRMQAFAGISDATLTHGDGWNFLQVGRYIERAYMTARILEALDVENEPWHESQRLLEMCCASVPFAQSSHRTPEARDAVAFIALSQDFPRSLRFCARELDAATHRISRSSEGTFANAAERRLGRLRARLDYTTIDEILAGGVASLAGMVADEIELLSGDIENEYFPRLPALDGVA
ncbi:MAG: alpha-E domain-containing protein [Candidatus Eremiobacteraeota bacterium]|nr:alpha-E domain-containing protein [Candidatus Eremiobacteraeota bacterium]